MTHYTYRSQNRKQNPHRTLRAVALVDSPTGFKFRRLADAGKVRVREGWAGRLQTLEVR